MTKRMYVTMALAAVALATQVAAWGAANAQSLYEQGIRAQGGIGQPIDLAAGQALLEQAAAAGSAMAMHRLGDMYLDGDGGVVKDYKKALEWYQKEADLDQTHPGRGAFGMLELGDAYAFGRGVPKDQAKAMEWYKKAAESAQIGANKGEVMAMLALAHCLSDGRGLKADPVQAWNWAMKASQTPNPWSYELIAKMYFRGIGVPKDPEKGLQYLLQATQMGVSQDMVDASLCFANGLGVRKDEKAAFEWAKKAVERGNSRAMAILGRYYHAGTGVERSDSTAREWYQKAIDRGDEAAMGFMGDLFVMPGVAQRDAKTAMTWYQEGVDRGDTYSMLQLAMLLIKDPDVVQRPDNSANNNRAATLLRQAADLGSAEAMNALGEMIRNRLVAGTREDAKTWFRKAAEMGFVPAIRNLGQMIYDEGLGVRRASAEDDNKELLAEGIRLLTMAANAGDVDAMADLGDACQFGRGVPQSMYQAAAWYRKAAEAGAKTQEPGSIRAARELGLLYLDGRSLGTDYQSAYKWLKMASDANDPEATAGLGELYELGVGLPQPQGATPTANWGVQTARPDYRRAEMLYRQAMMADHGAGFRGLAHLYQEGLGVEKNLEEAARLYQMAVDRGDQRAMEALGWMYELGQGVKEDSNMARRLFQRSYDEFGSNTAWSWLVSHQPDTVIPKGTRPATAPGGGTGGR